MTISRHRFTLILSGVEEITPELGDDLYDATGGDIELSMRDGVAFVEFERAVTSLEEVLRSAIAQVEGAGMRVARVEVPTE